MAKVVWSARIDSVSGALSKPSKGGQHSCEKMLLGTHRVAETMSNDCNRIYIRRKVKRSTTPSSREMENRIRFTAVRQAVYTRAHDLTKISQDQIAFNAQKNQAGGIRSMKAWYWKQEGDLYDAQHQ